MFLGNGKEAGSFVGAVIALPFMLVAFICKILFRLAKKILCRAATKRSNGKDGAK